MSDFSFIHAADIHLDSPLRGIERYEEAPVDKVRNATRAALTKLVGLAIEEKVGFLLLAGDLYDGDWRDMNTGAFFVREMHRLREARIPVFLIAGNHDARNDMTRELRLPDNVRFFASGEPETARLEDLGVAVHGQSFSSRKTTEDLSSNYPPGDRSLFNIGLLHTSATGFPEHETYAPCSVDGLRSKNYQYWALGHVHQRRVLCEDPAILFSGNTQGRHVRETGPKGCSLVRVRNGEIEGIEECPLDVVRWLRHDVDVEGVSTPEEAVDQVCSSLARPLEENPEVLLAMRIRLHGESDADGSLRADLERWRAEIRLAAGAAGSERIWVEKVQIETQPKRSIAVSLDSNPFLSSLAKSISDMEETGELPEELMASFSDLRRKIQVDGRGIEEDLFPDKPELVREALADVKQILLSQLIPGGIR